MRRLEVLLRLSIVRGELKAIAEEADDPVLRSVALYAARALGLLRAGG